MCGSMAARSSGSNLMRRKSWKITQLTQSRTMSEFTCPSCGETFGSEAGKNVHHSIVHGESINTSEVDCDNCGEQFEKRKKKIRETEHNFCSTACCGEFNVGKEYKTNTCKTCGEEFEYYKNKYPNGKKYCSKECLNNRGNKRVSSDCNNCGDTFEYYPGGKHSGKYCCIDCALDGYNRNGRELRNKYGSEFNKYRKNISNCENCGADCKLETHHIEAISVNERLVDIEDNMIALCYRCHASVDDHVEYPDDLGQKEVEWRKSMYTDNTERHKY